MTCHFYVLGEDNPRFTLFLLWFPPRGQIICFSNRTWTVEETEMRVDLSGDDPDTQLIVWLQERRAH